MCEYCDENNSPYNLLSFSDIDVIMNKRKIHWFLELSDRNYNDIMIINYCPMCGRKLKEGR